MKDMDKMEITDDWVRENFDLDAARQTINEKVRNSYDLMSLLDTNDSVEVTKRHFCEVMDSMVEEAATSTRVVLEIDCSEVFDPEKEIVVNNVVSREESDHEVIKRIKRREKDKIERKERKKYNEEKERREYERLRKKFEGQ